MKCPKCKKEVEEIYIEQEFTTTIKGVKNKKGIGYDYDRFAGYSLLNEWLDNMLVEKGKPKILGCENCI
jgi:hypothetical protein